MRLTLTLHPDSICSAATGVEVAVTRPGPGELALHYFVTGTISDLLLPPVTTPNRCDGLWQHSCFEAFIRAEPHASYYEFNFAPSTQWAAYGFNGYRSEMSNAPLPNPPAITPRSDGQCYELHALLKLDDLPDLPKDAQWQLGLACVIEEANGRKSYWALAHPPGQPDFHHPDGFAHNLPGT